MGQLRELGNHMKLVFSLIIYFSMQNCHASRIQILYQDGTKQHAQVVQLIFINKYKIPNELITIKKTTECDVFDKRFLELCIKKDSTLIVLPNKNLELIKSSFKVFYKGFKNAI